MNAMRASIEALGADYNQWRGLVGPLVKVGHRTAQTTADITKQGKNPRLISLLMKLVLGIVGLFTAGLSAVQPSSFLLSLTVLSLVALVVFFLLLLNFQSVAVSPMDYEVLGHRPVSPRTYLLARLAVTMAHQGLIAALLSVPSMVVCGIRFGWLCAAGLLLATFFLLLTVVLALIAIYGILVQKVGGQRLNRALTYVQLSLAFAYLIPFVFRERLASVVGNMAQLSLDGATLAIPTAWYAGLAGLVGGAPGPGELLGTALALTACGAVAWIARDKLSLASAEKLGAILQSQERARSQQVRSLRGGWFTGRLSWVVTLIRGQFRHDKRFRMGVLGLLPMLLVYFVLAFQSPSAEMPFFGSNELALFGINFAVMLAPALLLELLYASDSYRAGWVFFTTPVDRAQLAADARHCVTLFFFVPYLVLAAVGLVFLFEIPWAGLAHTLVLGCIGIFIMQLSQFLFPRLPFSAPPKNRTGWLLGLLAVGIAGISGALLPFAEFAYQRVPWTVSAVLAVVLAVLGMEKAIPARLNRKMRWLESEN